MEFVFHRFSPHRAIPHVSIVFFHIKTRIYSSFNTLVIVINTGALKSANVVIQLTKYLMMEYRIPLILMLMFFRGFVWASHQQQTNERPTAQLNRLCMCNLLSPSFFCLHRRNRPHMIIVRELRAERKTDNETRKLEFKEERKHV